MRYLLLGILVVGSVGCKIEVVVRDPVPVKDMFLRAGEDQVNNAQRVIVVPPEELERRAKQEDLVWQELKRQMELFKELKRVREEEV